MDTLDSPVGLRSFVLPSETGGKPDIPSGSGGAGTTVPAMAGRVVRALPVRGARQRDLVPAVQAALLPDPVQAEREMDRRPEARQGVAAELVALALAHLRHLEACSGKAFRGFGRSLGAVVVPHHNGSYTRNGWEAYRRLLVSLRFVLAGCRLAG